MQKSVIIILLFFCFCYINAFSFQHLKTTGYESFSVEEGLSQGTVYCVFQDSVGFLWIGTMYGLNKYDGKGFTHYMNDPANPKSLLNDIILTITEDRTGTLWIGTVNGGVHTYDRRMDSFTRYSLLPANQMGDEPLKNFQVKKIYEDRRGDIWVGTTGAGLFRFNRAKNNFIRYRRTPGKPKGLNSNYIEEILEDKNDNLLVGTRYVLDKMDRNTESFAPVIFNTYDVSTGKSSNGVTCMCLDKNGEVWIGTSGWGLMKFDHKTGEFTHYLNGPLQAMSNIIYSLLLDSTGTLWIGTAKGAFHFDQTHGTFISWINEKNRSVLENQSEKNHRKNYFNNMEEDFERNYSNAIADRINTIYEDRSGIIWLGTGSNGLLKYDRNMVKFEHYRKQLKPSESPGDNGVYSILMDKKGVLWIGTYNGGLNKYDRQKNTVTGYSFDTKNNKGLTGNFVTSLCEDNKGTLWIGIMGGGVNRLDEGAEKFGYYCKDSEGKGLSSNYINSVCNDKKGLIWIGTVDAGINSLNRETGIITGYQVKPGDKHSISDNQVLCLYVDRAGEVWVGTRTGGLNRYNSLIGGFDIYRFDPYSTNCLSSNGVVSICEDHIGIMWIGTAGGGLNRMDKTKRSFLNFTVKDGLPDNYIYGILEDDRGELWISTNRGISRFNPSKRVFINYTKRDGLQDFEFNTMAVYKSAAGELFFGGPNGFNSIYPWNIHENNYLPPIVFTDFKVWNKHVNIGKNEILKEHISICRSITLDFSEKVFSFSVAALDYHFPVNNRYQFKLEGFSKRWVDLVHTNEITFTNLDPGVYRLRVKGSNNDGKWSDKFAEIEIIINPPFWMTWWFRFLIISVIIGTVVMFHRTRAQKMTLKIKSESQMKRISIKYDISEREQEIIELILKGKSNKEIEDALFISIKTVKSHIYNIYKKLGVKNRLELIHKIQKSFEE